MLHQEAPDMACVISICRVKGRLQKLRRELRGLGSDHFFDVWPTFGSNVWTQTTQMRSMVLEDVSTFG